VHGPDCGPFLIHTYIHAFSTKWSPISFSSQNFIYFHEFGVSCLIITGSGFDDLIYLYFFTITINSDSSQSMTAWDTLHSLLDHERPLFHCVEWRTTNPLRINPLNSLNQLVSTGTHVNYVLSQKRWLRSNRGSTVDCVISRMCLLKRCLANGHMFPIRSTCSADIIILRLTACEKLYKASHYAVSPSRAHLLPSGP
jgi:hypothetical protein